MSDPGYGSTVPGTVPAGRPRYDWGGLAARIVLTLLGAAGLIVGGFLDWIRDTSGVDLSARAFFQTTFRTASTFLTTVGFVVIVLGLLAIVGLAFRSGWLTRLAGALGVVAFVLFLIEVYRANGTVGDIGPGPWVALIGGILALIAGFLGTRPRTVVTPGVAPTTTTVIE